MIESTKTQVLMRLRRIIFTDGSDALVLQTFIGYYYAYHIAGLYYFRYLLKEFLQCASEQAVLVITTQ